MGALTLLEQVDAATAAHSTLVTLIRVLAASELLDHGDDAGDLGLGNAMFLHIVSVAEKQTREVLPLLVGGRA